MRSVQRVDDAEARGDSEGALDLIEAHVVTTGDTRFWRPERIVRLAQLATVRPLPRWAVSRWVLAQAAGSWHRGAPIAAAMQTALDAGATDRLPVHLGADDVRIQVIDRDWVFRQALLHDLGGLTDFLPVVAPGLLQQADDLVGWSRCAMGGLRFLGHGDRVTRWLDVADRREIELDDLGSAAQLVEGDHVIGRLVPSEGRRLFDSPPLPVPREVADQVAADPGSWAEVLAEARRAGHRLRTSGFDFGLLHDMSERWWQQSLPRLAHRLGVRDDPRPATLRTDLAGIALDLARVSRPGIGAGTSSGRPDPREVEHCLAAAVLDPVVFDELLELVDPEDEEVLLDLARRVASPASSQLELLAVSGRLREERERGEW